MGFKTRELIFIALMAALLFVVNFSIGAGIIAVTGIPGGSALVTGITNLLVLTFVALVVRRFGTLGLLYLVYGVLALPTPMAGGPPGFVWKIPLLAGSVLFFELFIRFGDYRKLWFFVGLPVFTIVGFAVYLGTYWLLGMPEFGQMLKAVPILFAALMVLGSLGIWLGFALYNRLKEKRIIRQITA